MFPMPRRSSRLRRRSPVCFRAQDLIPFFPLETPSPFCASYRFVFLANLRVSSSLRSCLFSAFIDSLSLSSTSAYGVSFLYQVRS